MDKKTQDRLWACLPKEAREWLRKEYMAILNQHWCFSAYLRGRLRMVREIYGEHNLTSDAEPAELLFVKRKKVVEFYRVCKKAYDEENDACMRSKHYGETASLRFFFGDKCLPDEEKQNIPKHSNSFQIGKDDKPSVQVEPKFSKADKVRYIGQQFPKYFNEVFEVEYTTFNPLYGEYVAYLGQDGMMTLACIPFSDLEPYTEPETKETMEEKELNLCELLKGCEGEKFFSLMFGDVTFVKVIEEPNLGFGEKPIATSEGRYLPNAMYGLDGVPTLFPSRALYEKYPLDAYSAWMEWKEARKPKYEFTGCLYIYKEDGATADEIDLPDMNFNSLEEAQQVAEAVRECLEKFTKRIVSNDPTSTAKHRG